VDEVFCEGGWLFSYYFGLLEQEQRAGLWIFIFKKGVDLGAQYLQDHLLNRGKKCRLPERYLHISKM
jgi:hypothetical protein